MKQDEKSWAITIPIMIMICSGTLLVLIWIRDSMVISHQFFVDWLIVLFSILLEVFGISLLLDWLIDLNRKRRLEPRRQIALRRIFTALGRDLYIPLARNNKTGEPLTEEEDIQLRAKGIVTPSTNLALDRYIVQVVIATQSSLREIESLIDKFGDLFGIEFVNDLFQIGEIGYFIIQDGQFIRYYAKSRDDDVERMKTAEKVNETFDPTRRKLMEACAEFIVKRIYPQSSSDLKGKIRFYLLNFFVAYYPEISDIVLEGQRMRIPS